VRCHVHQPPEFGLTIPATCRVDLPRHRPGGAAYHNRNIAIFTVRDGKIAAVREYTDTQHAAHVLLGQQ